MTNKKRTIQQNGPSPSYVLNRQVDLITKHDNASTNIQIAAYRGPNNDLEYYSKIALTPFVLEGFIDDLPGALAEHPGAPKISATTIEQLRGMVKHAVDEMVHGLVGDVRVSFPTMRGIVSYGMYRRPLSADDLRKSQLTVHVNHKGKLTEVFSRPTAFSMVVKRAIFERVPHVQ